MNTVEQACVTGVEIQASMKAKNITSVDHHRCGVCGGMTRYFTVGDELFFDAGCGCASSQPSPRTWSSAAEWINMQRRADVRADIASRFGIVDGDTSPTKLNIPLVVTINPESPRLCGGDACAFFNYGECTVFNATLNLAPETPDTAYNGTRPHERCQSCEELEER